MAFGLTRISGPPCAMMAGPYLAPDRRTQREDPVEHHPQHQRTEQIAPEEAVDAEGNVTGVASRHDDAVAAAGKLDPDLGARISGAGDQHGGPGLSCAGSAVGAGMQLHDVRIEIAGKAGNARRLVVGHRHDHVLGVERRSPALTM